MPDSLGPLMTLTPAPKGELDAAIAEDADVLRGEAGGCGESGSLRPPNVRGMERVEGPQRVLALVGGVTINAASQPLDDVTDPSLVRQAIEVVGGQPDVEPLVADAHVTKDPAVSGEDLCSTFARSVRSRWPSRNNSTSVFERLGRSSS